MAAKSLKPDAPTFAVEASALDPTVAEVTGLAFSDAANTHTVNSGTFTFYYCDPTMPTTTLAASVGLAATSVTLTSATGISAGDYIQAGRNIFLCGPPSGTVIPVTPAQLGSLDDTEASGTNLYKLTPRVATAAILLDFPTSTDVPNWKLLLPLPNMRLSAVDGKVHNVYGDSPESDVCLTNNTDHGLLLTAPAPGATTVATYSIVNGTSTPSLSGNGTTGTPFILTAQREVIQVVATTQAVYLQMPTAVSCEGVSITVNRASGSRYSVWLRNRSGDDIAGSTGDYEISTDGAITVRGL